MEEEDDLLTTFAVGLFELFKIAKGYDKSYPYVLFSLEDMTIMDMPFFNNTYSFLKDNGFIYLNTTTKDFHYMINENFLTEQDIFKILTSFKITNEERKYKDNKEVVDFLFEKVRNFYNSKKTFN